jgi:hypothetical protein
MLFDSNGNIQTQMPYSATYESLVRSLSESDFSRIVYEIQQILNKHEDRPLRTKDHIPGYNSWIDSPYEPIFYAANGSRDNARFFFSQLLWKVTQIHRGNWYFVCEDTEDDRPINFAYYRKTT